MPILIQWISVALGSIPLSLRSALGWWCGYIFSFLPTRDRKIAALQLELFMHEQGGRQLLPRVYASLGQSLFESLNLAPLIQRSHLHVDYQDIGVLDALRSRGRGILFLSAHTGNWELLAATVAKHTRVLSVIGREANYPSFQRVLMRIRASNGIKTIWRSDAGSAKQIIKDLKDNRIIGALIDQDTEVGSVFAPFFGRVAKSPITVVRMALRLGTPIVIGFCFRSGFNRYILTTEEAPSNASEDEVIALFNLRLESYIRDYPEQWVWFHKRWRSSAGEKLSSQRYIEYLEQELANAA